MKSDKLKFVKNKGYEKMSKRALIICLFLSLSLGHWNSTQAQTIDCSSLKSAFKNLKHRPKFKYRKARKLLFSQLAPKLTKDKVVALYSGKQTPARRRKAPHGFNCEHLLPRAWMKKTNRDYKWQEADLHNLFPSEQDINSKRGHLPFGKVSRGTFRIGLDSQIGISPDGEEVIEARPQVRGDIVRTLLYMSFRWSIPLKKYQPLAILKEWVKMDPPSQVEKKRNRLIAELQGNYNPFVACPALAEEALIRLNGSRPFEGLFESQKSASKTSKTRNIYTWLKEGYASVKTYQARNALSKMITPPAGAIRSAAKEGSFAHWLRQLPMLPTGSPVYLHNGALKGDQGLHHSVIDIDIGRRDLQQCADAVMRLRAEYLFSRQKQRQKPLIPIQFNYTVGDKIPYKRWRRGDRPIVEEYRKNGRRRWRVKWKKRKARADSSYKQFKRYLDNIFSYAGTASLSKELSRRAVHDIHIGDIYLQGGYPGHAVIVLDLVEHPRYGKLMLLAQSYMPAQSPHILKNLNHPELSPWFKVPQRGKLYTPEWTFNATDLYRFRGKDMQ